MIKVKESWAQFSNLCRNLDLHSDLDEDYETCSKVKGNPDCSRKVCPRLYRKPKVKVGKVCRRCGFYTHKEGDPLYKCKVPGSCPAVLTRKEV